MKKRRGELIRVGSLFEKYATKLRPPERTVTTVVCEVIGDVMGYPIKENMVRYKVSTKTIELKMPSILKQEVLMHQNEIMVHLKGRLGETHAPRTIM